MEAYVINQCPLYIGSTEATIYWLSRIFVIPGCLRAARSLRVFCARNRLSPRLHTTACSCGVGGYGGVRARVCRCGCEWKALSAITGYFRG